MHWKSEAPSTKIQKFGTDSKQETLLPDRLQNMPQSLGGRNNHEREKHSFQVQGEYRPGYVQLRLEIPLLKPSPVKLELECISETYLLFV